MEKRLLFNGIGMSGHDFPVNQAIKNSILVFSDPANSSFAVRDQTKMGTELTFDLFIIQFFI
jgi:hypothetical protein